MAKKKKRKRYPQSRREKGIRYRIAHNKARIREIEAEKAEIRAKIAVITADKQRQMDYAEFRYQSHQLRLRRQKK